MAAFEAPGIAQFLTAYTESLSALENADTLTPAVAGKAREALGQAMRLAPAATPREDGFPALWGGHRKPGAAAGQAR